MITHIVIPTKSARDWLSGSCISIKLPPEFAEATIHTIDKKTSKSSQPAHLETRNRTYNLAVAQIYDTAYRMVRFCSSRRSRRELLTRNDISNPKATGRWFNVGTGSPRLSTWPSKSNTVDAFDILNLSYAELRVLCCKDADRVLVEKEERSSKWIYNKERDPPRSDSETHKTLQRA